MEYDLASKLNVTNTLLTIMGAGGANSTGLDCAGYESAGLILNVIWSSGTSRFKLQHSDSFATGYEDVPADETNLASLDISGSGQNGSYLFAYSGKKRYIRLNGTQIVATVSIVILVAGVRSDPKTI